MALIHCPECGREISDQAAACPGCGFPLSPVEPDETQRRLAEAKARDRAFLKRAGAALLLTVLVILGLIVLMAHGIL